MVSASKTGTGARDEEATGARDEEATGAGPRNVEATGMCVGSNAEDDGALRPAWRDICGEYDMSNVLDGDDGGGTAATRSLNLGGLI